MTQWKFEPLQKSIPKFTNPILIVGLPGIGNVGKITADFLIDELKAKPLYNIYSHELPNSVFVNDKNLIELPSIQMYYSLKGKRDVLILTGDVQPSDEHSSYEFCEEVSGLSLKLGVEMIITLGGIGLADVPKKPALYATGNSKEVISKFGRGMKLNERLYGLVGPIIGVSGLLVGIAGRVNLPAVCLLAETLGHPAYLGIKGAREIVKVLNKKYDLKINLNQLDKEIEDIESEILAKTQELGKHSRNSPIKKMQTRMSKETSYIG